MTKQEWLIGIIGLLGGIVLTVLVMTLYHTNHHRGAGMGTMMRMMGMGEDVSKMDMMGPSNSLSMEGMKQTLNDKSGDAFDKAFIEQMIPHHQGAIDMAQLAKKNANHREIQTMADDIMTAQAKEINDMKSWYKSWFGKDVETEHTSHHQ